VGRAPWKGANVPDGGARACAPRRAVRRRARPRAAGVGLRLRLRLRMRGCALL